MNRVKKFLKHPTYFALTFAVLYFLIGLILVLSHEQIFDEVNPWQIAKTITPENFFEVMRVEPHAPLWYLILLPFAKLGFPLVTANFISLTIMTITVYLFLRFSPFRRGTKLTFLLSAAFFYFFPVISRDYCLVPLALTLIAIAYPARLEHPIRYALSLALLVQSHFIMAGLAAALSILFIIDFAKHNKSQKVPASLRAFLVSLALIVLSGVSLLPSAIGSFGDHFIITQSSEYSFSFINFDKIGAAPETHVYENSLSYTEYSAELNSSLFFVFVPIFEIFAIAILLYLIINYRRLAFCLFSYLLVFFIATFFVYINFTNFSLKSATIISVLVFIYWLTFLEPQKPLRRPQKFFHKIELVRYLSTKKYLTPLLFSTIIICTIPFTVASAAHDFTSQYDRGLSQEIISQLNGTEDDAVLVVEGQAHVRNNLFYYIASITGHRVLYDLYYEQPMDYIAYNNNELEFKGYDYLAGEFKLISEKYHTDNVYYITIQGQNSCGDPIHVPYDDTWEYAFTLELKNSNYNLDVFKIKLDRTSE
ncbi:hypothetical protein IJG66_00135 [Candidatus Saccharibacteria bacterium]|nr:hypothetical protein [Candidatus Saccharibacteria bacterium]